jgi:hypothetical protein
VLGDTQPQVLFAPERQIVQNLNVIGGLPESVRAVILFDGPADDDDEFLPFDKFMDYGGVLDTAERAAMWRTSAKAAQPEDIIAIEFGDDPERAGRREVSHSTMVHSMVEVARRFPPARGRVHLLAGDRPDRPQRALLFSGWANGLTQTAFATTSVAREAAGTLRPDLVACPEAMVGAVLEEVREQGEEAGKGAVGQDIEGAGAKRRLSLFVTDGFAAVPRPSGGEAVEFVQPNDLHVEPAVGGAGVLAGGSVVGSPGSNSGGAADDDGSGG